MAAIAAAPTAKRRKPMVYGKSYRKHSYTFTHVGDFLDDEPAAPVPVENAERQAIVKTTYAAEKPEAKVGALKAVKPRAETRDPFDVPSSDDEDTATMKALSPLRAQSKRKLVDERETERAQLAPWEKKKVSQQAASSRRAPTAPATHNGPAESRLSEELGGVLKAHDKAVDQSVKPRSKTKHPRSVSQATSPESRSEKTLSAAARLAARRQLLDTSTQSSSDDLLKPRETESNRNAEPFDKAALTPQKRKRDTPAAPVEESDMSMANPSSATVCEAERRAQEVVAKDDADIYDFPESSSDGVAASKATVQSPVQKSRRCMLPKSSAKSTPRKGLSAPARLSEMLLPDDDTEANAATHDPLGLPSTPEKPASDLRYNPPSTPAAKRLISPATAVKVGTMTQKQVQLWDQLLPSDPAEPSPSSLPMKDLRLGAKRRVSAGTTKSRPSFGKSKSDVAPRRVRLVDMLKASAPSSSDESDESDPSDLEMNVSACKAEVKVATAGEHVGSAVLGKPTKAPQSQAPQSQAQASAPADSGPRITYARSRSHLADDSLEDGLMLDLPLDTPQRPAASSRRTAKPSQASQKSAFDLDDSDDEAAGAGKLRTIHELRAAGRSKRVMQDIDALLTDIVDHNVSARSRRRSAFVELSSKMMDKAFVERFVAHGYERQLIAECKAAPDLIADFVLGVAFLLMLAAEPEEHTILALKEDGILPWLSTSLLDQDVAIGKIARDRRHNTSKAAQGALLNFAEMSRKAPNLWKDEPPATLTPRLVALKALDLLVGRLRRLGDKSELIGTDSLALIGTHHPLAISVLESLSTSALSLDWPEALISDIAALLPNSAQNAEGQHTRFLIYRLSLNLTNEKRRNCAIFAAQSMPHLLSAMVKGAGQLDNPADPDQRTLDLDFLVLATGITINLAEHSPLARQHTLSHRPLVTKLLSLFQQGQTRALEAESVEESTSNVAYGYLAVMFANLCQTEEVRKFIAECLPGECLSVLLEALREFVRYHEEVDMLGFEGEQGREVWGKHTEKLRGVLGRLEGSIRTS